MGEPHLDAKSVVEQQPGPDFDKLTGLDFESALSCAASGLRSERDETNAKAKALISKGNTGDQEYMTARRHLNEKAMARETMADFLDALTEHADFLDLNAAEASLGGLVNFDREILSKLAIRGGWKEKTK